MIQIKEGIIKKVNSLQFGGLTVTLHIKAEDYTREDRDKLEQLWSDGTSVVLVMNEFGEKQLDNTPKLRQILALVIQDYATARGESIEDTKKYVYSQKGIESSKTLNEKELKEAIEFTRLGIQELQIPFN